YEQGDDYRAIDWNVSARMGSPYVKLFAEERELTLLLVVDRSGSVEFGDPLAKSHLAVEISAVLALAAARNNDRVGAVIFSEGVDHIVPPAKGKKHALRVIRDLAMFRPVRRRTNIAAVLSYTAKLLTYRAIVVIVSDFRDVGWEKQLAKIASRHEVVAITIDDPREMELPDAGWVELEDAETGDRLLVDTSDGESRLRMRIAAEEARLNRARALEQSGADHLALRTDRPYAGPMHEKFAQRARRYRR
ncbi:MAG: DUF58 domain-containing protein, partial [Gemmatimonadales bacterium]